MNNTNKINIGSLIITLLVVASLVFGLAYFKTKANFDTYKNAVATTTTTEPGSDNTALLNQIAELEGDINDYQNTIADLQSQLDELEADSEERAELEAEIAQLETQIEYLQNQISSISTTIDDFTITYDGNRFDFIVGLDPYSTVFNVYTAGGYTAYVDSDTKDWFLDLFSGSQNGLLRVDIFNKYQIGISMMEYYLEIPYTTIYDMNTYNFVFNSDYIDANYNSLQLSYLENDVSEFVYSLVTVDYLFDEDTNTYTFDITFMISNIEMND